MTDTVSVDSDGEDTAKAPDSSQEAAAARVDEFLTEFDEAEPKPTEEPKADDAMRRVEGEVKALREQVAANQINDQLTALKERLVSSDEDFSKLPPELISDVIDGAAKRDPRLEQAFIKSLDNPKYLNDLVGLLSPKLRETVDAISTRSIADDVAAATGSARSISTKEPQQESVNTVGMSDAEFNQHKKTLPLR